MLRYREGMIGSSMLGKNLMPVPSHPFREKDILSPLGYKVTYCTREKYRGAEPAELCIAIKDGLKHYGFKIGPLDSSDHHRRIQQIQDTIPHMTKIVVPSDGVVLSIEAQGQNLWDIEPAPEAGIIEDQLLEFARATEAHHLVHGDLRPWNVFFDPKHGVQVIDWRDLSAFVDDLLPCGDHPPRRGDLLSEANGHYKKVHPDLVAQGNFTEIDRMDALLIGKLLRSEIRLRETWPPDSLPSQGPSWCRL